MTRFAGSFIDGLILGPVVVLASAVKPTSVLVSLLFMLPSAAYTIILIARRGQTVGEKAMDLRVARRSDGMVPGWTVSIRRWALPATPALVRLASHPLGAILGLLVLVDFLWALWDPNRQCLHDKLADTVVVQTA
jgi:uncharacterized RDD family membrane protein YckC